MPVSIFSLISGSAHRAFEAARNFARLRCVVVGDEHGGIVSRVSTLTLPARMIAAKSWCGRYGLDAEETRMLRFDPGEMQFACVPPPGAPQ